MHNPIFTGELLRLAAPLPEDSDHFAKWSQDGEYMRLLDDDPVRPMAPANFAHFGTPNSSDYYFHHLSDDHHLSLQIQVFHEVALAVVKVYSLRMRYGIRAELINSPYHLIVI